mmetsp:Transcript_119450/g.343121  ORF Transcript_119450/g.343121 Transcript_119450/m.343121 type:complete len:193 (+) Transcript_119450:260-838(+)
MSGSAASRRAPQARLDASVLERIRDFLQQSRMKKAALRILVREVSDGKICDLREAFEALDTDLDGRLSREELASGMAKAGIDMQSLDIGRLLQDPNGLEYSEFLAATVDLPRTLSDSDLRSAFLVLDQDADGMVSVEEFEVAGGSGGIDFQGFVEMMRSQSGSPESASHPKAPPTPPGAGAGGGFRAAMGGA